MHQSPTARASRDNTKPILHTTMPVHAVHSIARPLRWNTFAHTTFLTFLTFLTSLTVYSIHRICASHTQPSDGIRVAFLTLNSICAFHTRPGEWRRVVFITRRSTFDGRRVLMLTLIAGFEWRCFYRRWRMMRRMMCFLWREFLTCRREVRWDDGRRTDMDFDFRRFIFETDLASFSSNCSSDYWSCA